MVQVNRGGVTSGGPDELSYSVDQARDGIPLGTDIEENNTVARIEGSFRHETTFLSQFPDSRQGTRALGDRHTDLQGQPV